MAEKGIGKGENPTPEEESKKENVFKRFGKAVMRPIRFVGRKIKESPASAAIGALGGAGLALGGKFLIEHYAHRDVSETVDPVEIEVEDSGEEYTTPDELDEAV